MSKTSPASDAFGICDCPECSTPRWVRLAQVAAGLGVLLLVSLLVGGAL